MDRFFRNYTILIIDKSDAVFNRAQEVLKNSPIISRLMLASSGVEAFKLLLNHRVDLILCSIRMPGIDDSRLISMLHNSPELGEIPIIALIDEVKGDERIEALRAGAQESFDRSCHDEELLSRISSLLHKKSLQDTLDEKNRKIEELSKLDSLTKVSHRHYLLEILELEFLRAERYSSFLSFMICSLDNFKELTVKHGGVLGDRVLVTVANKIRDCLRINDLVGRFNEEEFGIILPETNIAGAANAAERYRLSMAELPFYNDQERINITGSFGVVCYPHQDIRDVKSIIEKADKAVHIAKAGGFNRVVVLE